VASGDEQNQGLPEAHTPGEFSGAEERAAKIGATRAATEAAMADLVAQVTGGDEAEQASLMLDEMDEQFALFKGPVAHVARQLESAKSGPGRPKGSRNKANEKFKDTLMRMGFRHPGLNLAALANASPLPLALEWLGLDCSDREPALVLADAITAGTIKRAELAMYMRAAQDMISKANAELMPYFESKAPVEVNVDRRTLGVMLIGEMSTARGPDDDGTISLTKVAAPT
jgi:hypothetical protein